MLMGARSILAGLFLLATVACLPPAVARAEGSGSGVGAGKEGVADLQEQLESGLRAFRKEDKQYIAQVVRLVQQGRLSRGSVNYAYKDAIKRRPSYPLPYFQQVLRVLARQSGVTI